MYCNKIQFAERSNKKKIIAHKEILAGNLQKNPFRIQCASKSMAKKEHVIKYINQFLCILI